MGEEVKMMDHECAVDGEERVTEWEAGLPGAEDLVPLSQSLVSPVLASAFSISAEPCRSVLDVNRASQNSLPGLRERPPGFRPSDLKAFDEEKNRDSQVMEGDDDHRGGADSRMPRRIDCAEEADSAPPAENSADHPSGRAPKRPRLVWTPQLHKRFVDVVAHLGIKNAVPKTIMQLMNVDGLTRENVASHLQKYRLYLKRIQGTSSDGPSASDHLFASTSLPQNLHESGGTGSGQRNGGMSSLHIPMPYATLAMPMPMPAFGLPHGHAPMGIPPPAGAVAAAAAYHGFQPNGMLPQRDWPRNKFGSTVAFPHPTHNDK